MQFRRKPNKVQAIQLTQDLIDGNTVIAPKGCWLVIDSIKGQFFMTDELFKEEYELDLPGYSGVGSIPPIQMQPFWQQGIRAINTSPVIDPNEITCGGPRDL